MQSIRFDDGYKEFCINDDETKVIRINPTDYSLIERYKEVMDNIASEMNSLKEDIALNPNGEPKDLLEESAAAVTQSRKYINDQIDYLFASPVSSMAFGLQSPLSSVGGISLVERFMNAVGPMLEKEIKKENAASEKRINKYIGAIK